MQLTEFPRVAREQFGITAVELNSPFFPTVQADYVRQLRQAAIDAGVTIVGIAVDGQGDLAQTDTSERNAAVENHRRWLEAAAVLGCGYVRANSGGRDCRDEAAAIEACTQSFARLARFGSELGVKVAMENHGGLSRRPEVMTRIIRDVDSPMCGSLPDFGNWPEDVDRYAALEMIAPFAVGVHAKSYAFSADGEETTIDYRRCIQILQNANYDGPFAIEYEGQGPESEGIIATKKLLEKYAY